MDLFQTTGHDEVFKTLAGGPTLIFEMAHKLILFSDINKTTTKQQRRRQKKSKTLTFENHQPSYVLNACFHNLGVLRLQKECIFMVSEANYLKLSHGESLHPKSC